ncbi:MAG: hypothetical protein A2Y57_02200 [Candidatus Woykebacteria bacterium RBG_13_40_7b]|uniref:LytR/CpsA/Psr regulator C-terminal domain-containing protein n=1 Tax=Candidatus Woykebacteria bacterium RBG_13_40_7b TaxID=1802594 RepID=A0A1G1W8M6_9BACT|nr:MAG: hypothetical protein A2Y57_02200 [Candidatus Woykebacteria bacterium RBG_13_40_7b]
MLFKDSFIETFDKFFKVSQVTKEEVKKEASPAATYNESTTSAKEKESTPSAQEATQSAEAVLDKSTLRIKVLNGSGIEGAGQEAANLLQQLGYTIVSVSNASTFDYETTQIQIKESRVVFNGVLTNDLEAKYTITSGQALGELEEFDALVTVGKP